MSKRMEMKVAENLSVRITVDQHHEFVMPTSEVAKGYGVAAATIRSAKHEHREELVEGKHFVSGVVGISNDPCKSNDYNDAKQIFWTKRVIVRLGFFIRSERARMFRDWAEDLVISTAELAERDPQVRLFPEPARRKHNHLSPERMISILEDVAQIDDKKLRLSLVGKLTNY